MAPNRPPDPPRMAPEEPNCQHTGSPVRWETSGSDGPVVSPAGKSAAEVAFTPDPPRIGPWKTILGEWCNGSTTGSEPVSLGSNPSSPVLISALKTRHFGIRTRNAGGRREGPGLCRGYAGGGFAPSGSPFIPPASTSPRVRSSALGQPGPSASPAVFPAINRPVCSVRASAKHRSVFRRVVEVVGSVARSKCHGGTHASRANKSGGF